MVWAFIDNNNRSVLDAIRSLLPESDEVLLAVAFVRQSGVDLLKDELQRFVEQGGIIRLLFGRDMGLTEAEAIRRLHELRVDVRCYSASETYHPKAYVFRSDTQATAIIGSANLSASGLESGREWSLLLDSERFDLTPISEEFERLWESRNTEPFSRSLLDTLNRFRATDSLEELAKREDQPILSEPRRTRSDLDYFLHRAPDRTPAWWFQMYESQMMKHINAGGLNLRVICDWKWDSERSFTIPFVDLQKKVLSYATRTPKKGANPCIHFWVNKETDEFKWNGIESPMPGRQYLDSPDAPDTSSAGERGVDDELDFDDDTDVEDDEDPEGELPY